MTGPALPARVCLFAGPSLPPDSARWPAIDGAEIALLPPAQLGDVLRASRDQPTLIGLLDGAAPPAPSVSHKEILYAMEQGVRVLGAAGIGAIRAAELAEAGMDGIGEIYRWYRTGVVDADDEVALRYHPESFDPITVPTVNLRHSLRRAQARGIISPATAHAALSCARRIHFNDRTTATILAALAERTEPADVDKLRSFLDTEPGDLNRADALAAVSAIAAGIGQSHGLLAGAPRVRCPQTDFLRRLRSADEPAPGAIGDPPAGTR